MKEKQIRVRLPLNVYVDGLIFYDAQNQLLSETIGSDTTSYTYDTAGNIRSITGPSVSKSFSYNDSGDWKDLLTSVTVNGTTRSITYEEENGVTIGNPLSYFNGTQYTLAWQNGRQLASLSGGGKSATYTYGADGIRTGKTVTDASGTTTYQYTTQNGQIARQSWSAGGTAYQMDFIYDATGRPLAMYYRTKTASQTDFNGDSYYYETNQQGDVTGLYKITYNAATKALTATRVASYEYDAWGNVTYSTGTMAKINPLKYRGYYHDAESGFYYLQSRYYDPAIGRFINADDTDTLYDILGSYESSDGSNGISYADQNLFVYTINNPVNMSDSDGDYAMLLALTNAWNPVGWVAIAILAVVVIAEVASFVTYEVKKNTTPKRKSRSKESEQETENSSKGKKKADGNPKEKKKERSQHPIGRRYRFNTKKKAKEAAKRAGKGKYRNDYQGRHYHPDGVPNYRTTPKGASAHDHYNYPRR